MAITFNADEVFEMAEEIERNAAAFYREAAKITKDKDTNKMLLDLASMEDGHMIIFKEMRLHLTGEEKERTTFDPDNEAAMYLQTMADIHGTEGKISRTKKLTGTESTEEILKIALNSEKDSVVFYCGLRNYVSDKAGSDKLAAIVREEISHITAINKKLIALKK